MNNSYREFLLEGERVGMRYALAVPRTTSAALAGLQMGQRAGSSLEFKDHRDYQPGDDLRRIDWNAFARSDRLTVKLFREEISPRDYDNKAANLPAVLPGEGDVPNAGWPSPVLPPLPEPASVWVRSVPSIPWATSLGRGSSVHAYLWAVSASLAAIAAYRARAAHRRRRWYERKLEHRAQGPLGEPTGERFADEKTPRKKQPRAKPSL